MMNDHGGEYSPCCYIHPKQVVVGVCALCLRDRLLNLALKQSQHIPKDSSSRPFRALKRKTSITIPRVFALGSFLRLDTRRPRPENDDSDRESIASLEVMGIDYYNSDSFISIKFEDNGEASWDSKKKKAAIVQRQGGKGLVEQSKPRMPSALRWRKRIGQLLQLARRKRSTGGGAGAHVGIAGKVEGRGGWMGRLTSRRRTTGSS